MRRPLLAALIAAATALVPPQRPRAAATRLAPRADAFPEPGDGKKRSPAALLLASAVPPVEPIVAPAAANPAGPGLLSWANAPSRRRADVDRSDAGDAAAPNILRGRVAAPPRAAGIFSRRVAAPPRLRRGYSVETNRGAAAAGLFCGDESRLGRKEDRSRRRRGSDVDRPRTRGDAATPAGTSRARRSRATGRTRRTWASATTRLSSSTNTART